MVDIEPSKTMKMESLTDLLRLVVSIMSRGNAARYLYYGQKDGHHIYFMTHSVGGWYKLRGLPVTIAAFTDIEPETNFIEYTSPVSGETEGYKFVDELKTASTSSVPIPIIRLAELPDFMIQ
ncbi:MAG: hypothetical protein ACXAE3_15360 [Candidatus Kariarchaeaceae archaeon]|jgi:hypothetical protein